MATTSDERREVAARLRNEGRALTAIDMGVELASLTLDDAIGIEHNATWEECFDRLADLIDPTCENKYRNHGDRSFMCSECGYEAFTYGDSNCDPDDFAFCPHCGARVTRGGDE